MGLFDFLDERKKKKAAQKATEKTAALKEEALKNMRQAREALGDETIQKIANALSEQNKSAGKKAQEQIRQMDKSRVADHLKSILGDRPDD